MAAASSRSGISGISSTGASCSWGISSSRSGISTCGSSSGISSRSGISGPASSISGISGTASSACIASATIVSSSAVGRESSSSISGIPESMPRPAEPSSSISREFKVSSKSPRIAFTFNSSSIEASAAGGTSSGVTGAASTTAWSSEFSASGPERISVFSSIEVSSSSIGSSSSGSSAGCPSVSISAKMSSRSFKLSSSKDGKSSSSPSSATEISSSDTISMAKEAISSTLYGFRKYFLTPN